jgi:hypothetical protein
MSKVSISLPEDLEPVLKSMIERDPTREQSCSGLDLKHDKLNCTSSGKHCVFPHPDLLNSWELIHGR